MMPTPLPISGLLFLVGGVLLFIFGLLHLQIYYRERTNVVNSYYMMASLSISLALCVYGLPSTLGAPDRVIALGGMLATVINVFGFGSFLLVPLYSWFGRSPAHTVARYCVALFVVLVFTLFILMPAGSFVDSIGAIHWRFNPAVSYPVLIFMVTSFTLNVMLLFQHFSHLKNVSLLNVFALIFTFTLTGISGSYLYAGDNGFILIASSVVMPIGIAGVSFSALKSLMIKKY